MRHIVKTQTFNRKFLEDMFDRSRRMRKVVRDGGDESLKGKVVATLFYEPSTRTRLSFESATMRLGARVLSTESARQFSSSAKGETLEDTIRTIHSYADLIVLRYHEEGGAARAAHVSKVPVINAGDGKGQHPTQSLLDLFTIEEEMGQIDGLTVLLSGDLKHSRTIHSLAYLLGKFEDVKLVLASPPGLEMPQGILEYLERHKVEHHQADSLHKAVAGFSPGVLYQTRTQKERFVAGKDGVPVNYDDVKDAFTVSRDLMRNMKQDSIVLHPMPRVDEIRYGVDDDPRAKYFIQSENGVYVRMALLEMLLE